MRTLHNLHTVDVGPGEIGVTARNGTKWSNSEDGERNSIHEEIVLCECLNNEHKVVGSAIIEQVWLGQFQDIPAKFIEQEHELSSRYYTGLLSSMRRAYGEDFSENSPITILAYRRIT